MRKRAMKKKAVSLLLAVVMSFTGILPATAAFAADGVEGYYDIELFYSETDTIVPSTMLDDSGEEVTYIEYMVEGDELELTYKLIDTTMPDNGYITWYSETPTLVDVTDDGVVKAFDSSKGAVVQTWIDNEVATIPLVGSLLAEALETVLFNDYVDLDTMDTDAIIALVEDAFGSNSILANYVDTYEGDLIDSLRYYLDNINSNIHVQLYDSDGTLLDDDYVQICVTKNEEWYAAFLPNGTHITNKSSINTTVAVGSTVQLTAVTTPVRLEYGCVYSVKSSSIFEEGKVVATVDDSGLVTFKNTGTVTIVVSPDSEQVIENILAMVNYFYAINTELIDSTELADILITYVGLDINRNVLAAILDACFAVYDIVEDTADPVQLTATAVKLIANLVLQFAYNDTITFTVVDAEPITDFSISGANTVKEGSQIQLSITDVEPTAGDTSDITWTSSDPSIASVDSETGVITGRDAGGSLGSFSTQTCTIYATSAANNIVRSYQITVTGKTGKYLSDIDIIGESYLEMGMETDYSYTIYPQRVAESDNLYITWGMVTDTDDEGNSVYTWADSETAASDGLGSIDSSGHYTVISGGISTIALKAQTGYYLSDGSFYEISSLIKEFDVTNGIPVESITINADEALGIASSMNGTTTVTINGEEYTYVSIKAGTQYYGLGASISADIYPANASNQTLTWVVDNGYYNISLSDDTLTAEVTQVAGHENADTFNVYAVSADGEVCSNVITVCISKNNVTDNIIVDEDGNETDTLEVVNGYTADVYHSISFESSSDGTYSACYKCNWYSSDESIFTVETKTNDNRDATVTAVDVGTATLYCVSADGGVVDTCEVTVYPNKEYLSEIVNLCDKTIIIRTSDNASLYKQYMGKLDLAYTVLYDFPMASQATCDTYADELLIAFYKLGGYIGISGVEILDKGSTTLEDKYVTVSVGSVSNYTNYSYEFDFDITPSSAMYSSVTWTSSDSSVSVDSNGICTPTSNSASAAMITCTVTDYLGNSASDSVYIAFSRTEATGVNLDTTTITGGKIGETQTLTATVSPTNILGSSSASNTDVIWSSSDEEIATVDENGVVTFVAGGDCVITVTTIDGGYTAQCAVNVVTNYSALELLVQQYNDLSLNSVNYYPDSWEVYEEAMTKAQNMLDLANSSQSEVDAMYAELEDAYNSLEKYNYIQSVELYLDGEQTAEFYQYDLSLLSEGISYTNAELDLNVRLYPNNGSYQSVEWTSSTSDISVTTDGKASPTVNSSCYGMITCTVNDHYGNSFTDSVWVSFAYYPVTSLELSDSSISGEIGSTYTLACTVYPTGTSLTHIGAASIQDYYWESDDESIATIDDSGTVTFVSAGATTVRAVSYDGGFYAECQVSTEGDRTALKQALSDYADVDYTDYEYDYGIAFKEAYEAAEAALTDVTYTQDDIDTATENLVSAYEALADHPYVSVDSADITYTTTKKSLLGSTSQVTSGTVGSSDALSIDLSSDYSNYNNYNYVTLTAAASPSDAMYESIEWSVDSTSDSVETSLSNSSITITPTETGTGAWAIVTATITDCYGRTTTRTIYVTLSDSICTGFEITEDSQTVYATDDATQIDYTLSGSPEFDTIYWTSSDTSVVTVDDDGVITPVEKGSATITAVTLDGGYSDKITITVLTDFTTLVSKQNEYYNYIQDVKDSYTYTEDSLENLSAVVSEAQTMINDGSATQAEVDEMIEKLDDAYESLVYYIPVLSVSISAEEDDYVTVVGDGYIRYTATLINGKSFTLTPVFNDDNAVYTDISWSSSSDTITVDEDGVVTNSSAVAGVAEITCSVTNVYGTTFTASAYVTFARYGVTGISFDDEMVYGAPAQTVTLSPSITNSNNSSLSSSYVSDCVYTSSDTSIATVDDDGVVTFISQGEATITATTLDGGYTATIVAYTTWDTTALLAAIEEAEAIDYTDYAYDYGTAFYEAYQNALTVSENIYAEQDEIDEACTALTEAITALSGNEFIVPEISLTCDDTEIADGDIIQVDADTQQTVISLVLNDGAMVKSSSITVSNESNVSAEVNGNDITITKTADNGSMTVSVTVIDDYDREYTQTYSLSFIDEVIPVTAVVLSVDGEELGSTYAYSCGGSYSDLDLTIDYNTTPEDANAITSVTYTSSATTYVTVDDSGVISLTTAGKLRSSNTATITCTVTNADGSTASASVNLTITRA